MQVESTTNLQFVKNAIYAKRNKTKYTYKGLSLIILCIVLYMHTYTHTHTHTHIHTKCILCNPNYRIVRFTGFKKNMIFFLEKLFSRKIYRYIF
jgi:hypothetical protein